MCDLKVTTTVKKRTSKLTFSNRESIKDFVLQPRNAKCIYQFMKNKYINRHSEQAVLSYMGIGAPP